MDGSSLLCFAAKSLRAHLNVAVDRQVGILCEGRGARCPGFEEEVADQVGGRLSSLPVVLDREDTVLTHEEEIWRIYLDVRDHATEFRAVTGDLEAVEVHVNDEIGSANVVQQVP